MTDPDANWSTVTKHEKKKSMHGNMQSSGPFHLRLPDITVENSKDRGTDVKRTEKKHDTQTKRRIEEHYAPDDDASPSGSAAQLPHENGSTVVRLLLQADSDESTLAGEVDEQVFAFDVGESLVAVFSATLTIIVRLIVDSRYASGAAGSPESQHRTPHDNVAGATEVDAGGIIFLSWTAFQKSLYSDSIRLRELISVARPRQAAVMVYVAAGA
ncbi:hypothetical protein EDB19DRAFT_1911303 [Suillus lakei]|nr:hypothetical protein EDB19DRAFT_1911303 [Suillus lakei]